jgi:GTP-binding protein
MFAPFGGPNGGDGGRGGDIVLKVNRQLSSFAHLYGKKELVADDGEKGSGNQCTGSDGEDVLIEIPLGTVLKDSKGKPIRDFTVDGEEFVFLRGGIGGQGNQHFATSVNQAPRYAQKGLPGQEAMVIFELKLIADIGLVGFPNAGKSTFIASVTNARPKIGPYPFTTLTPGLGIYKLDELQSLVIADIPGIIEGAHEGKGLGHEFLRHIERTRFLFFLIDSSSASPYQDYLVLMNELRSHSKTLAQKPFAIGISKMDLHPAEDVPILMEHVTIEFPEELKSKLLFFSSLSRSGIDEFRKLAYGVLQGNDRKLI